jgi:hypothetical protein
MNKNFFILLFLFFLSSSYAEQSNDIQKDFEKIILPKIPIYINNPDIANNFTFNLFQIESKENSFYKINISNLETNYKKMLSDEQKKEIIGGSIIILGAGIGWDFGTWLFSGEIDDNGNMQKDSFKLTGTLICTSIATLLGLNSANSQEKDKIPISKTYHISCKKSDDILNSETITIPYSDSLDSYIISDFILNSDSQLRKWNNVAYLSKDYNNDSEFDDIEQNFFVEMKKLLLPKGEFETTQQYEERIKNEKVIKKELVAKYEQELKIAKEQDRLRKLELYQEIKEEIKNIEFTKSFDFEISNYDADNQTFTFYINDAQKKVVVPFMRAPMFKENISNLCIQKNIRPTLHGTWETINDDYVLFNTKTNAIVHWEGSVPTIAAKSVENPPHLTTSIELIDSNGDGFLDAEENAILKVKLSNQGEGPALKTRLSLFQESGSMLYYDVTKTIEEIKPNETSNVEFSVKVPQSVTNDEVSFKLVFIEEQGFEPEPVFFTAETREMRKPEFKVVDFGIDDANGDGIISKGETFDMTIRIQNIGYGKAEGVLVTIEENRLENVFIISDKSLEVGDLESGETKDCTYTISTNNRVSDIINIRVYISEQRPFISFEDKIILEIEKTQKHLEPVVFKGTDEIKNVIYADNLSIDIEQNIPLSKKTNNNAIAVILGIENYRNISNVNFAFRDATIMKEYFSKAIGIPDENIYFRANDDVTLGEFNKIFSPNGWLEKRVEKNKTDIYIYYAGHGAPAIKEEKAFLIPYDGDPNYPVQTGYSLETIYENLSELNAKSVTVFLDACFTGTNRENEMLLADARPVSIQLRNNYVKNVTVFSATSSNEISSSYPQKKHGLFSYFLMKGIQGKADANRDNQLTIQELFDYVKSNVSKIAGTLDREQTPQLECLEPEKVIINYQD